MELELVGIKFWYLAQDSESLASPVTLPTSPEWPPQRTTASVYPLSKVKDKEVFIQCCFKSPDTTVATYKQWLQVRAIRVDGPDAGQVITQEKIYIGSDTYSTKNSIFGYLTFPLNPSVLWEEAVGVYPSEWQWQWQLNSEPDSDWQDFEVSRHDLYLTLDVPAWPWSRFPNDGGDQPPWLRILKTACIWAAGSTEKRNAATLITERLHETGLFHYSTLAAYTDTPSSDKLAERDEISPPPEDLHRMLFKCSAFTDRLSGLLGLGANANCTDFAYMLLILGNSIGCGLKTVKLEGHEEFFAVHPTQPIGWEPDSQSPADFPYHEVAWLGEQFDETALIFDASLGFFPEEGESEDNLNPVTHMPYGDQEGVAGYRTRLAKDPEDLRTQEPETVFLRIN